MKTEGIPLMEVDEVSFKQFVNDYKPYLSYGECFVNKFPVINYCDVSNGKKWPDCLMARVETDEPKTFLIRK